MMKPEDQLKVLGLGFSAILVMVAVISFVSVKTTEMVASHGGGHATEAHGAAADHAAPAAGHEAAKTEEAAPAAGHEATKTEDHAAPKTEEHAAKTEDTAKKDEHAAPKADEHAAKTEDHGTEKTAAASGGNAEAGGKVFMAKTCATCHAVSKLEGAKGAIGPKLDGLGKTAATRVAGKSAEDYIKESIENPSAFVVSGFQPMMPPGLKAQMSDQEYKDLVAFLVSL